ncbi:MAG: RNA 2',3'-cyclic phosphodiesterase [Deltaproteobacteria bacterium]|nr:RNA 2',3'-cyclic phosphodiesterase [Deltaproteobacteria bacterium]
MEILKELEGIKTALDRGWRGISWVKPASIHLTLKFLGEIDPAKADAIATALEYASKGIGPFEVKVSGLGAFPNMMNPRVLWAGIGGNDALKRLSANIEDGLEPLGFEREGRPFTPHLTLCRVKSSNDGRALGKTAAEANISIDKSFTASAFHLIKSVLNPRGAEYTDIKTIGLE